ncbi:MAG: ABC transporter substrate-binding protein [Candidatus Marinarcus sp.]|uniref:ABC transporter substrate-binding protein n=1 Tax=Candidatus Marinarcus sp. TaxID=3100987 RepID=UPI003AFFBDF0
MSKRFLIFFLFCFIVSTTLNAKELKKVTLQLSWFDQFQFAGYYMAKEKGFYEEAGFDVEIKPFTFGTDIPLEVSEGKIDFAVGRETLILERAKKRKIVALYALFQATPLVLLATEDSQIKSVNDFKNKRIMTTIDDSSEVSLKAMISSHNIQLSDLKFLKHTHNINDLVNKNTDIISAYISKTPYDLQKMGVKYTVFDPKKFGFDMYSDFLYTNENLINNEMHDVNAFKNASLKGWQYAYSHIKLSVDVILKKYNSQHLSKEALLFEANALKKLSYFKNEKLGLIKEDKVQRIYDLYNVMGLVENPINIEDFFLPFRFSEDVQLTQKELDYLKNKKSIKMCIIPNVMPYSGVKGEFAIGFVADYIELIKRKLNIKIDLVKTETMTETLAFLKDKKCDMIPGIQMTEERKSYLNFSNPYLKVPFVLVTRNNEPFYNDISNLHQTIALVKGYAISELLKRKYKNIKFVDVETIDEALKQISKGEVFGTISPLSTALYKIQNLKITNIKISSKLDETNNIRVGVVKDETLLFDILDKTVNSIGNSTVNNLLNKWLYVQYDKEVDYGFLWKVLALFILISGAILYRQKLLKTMNKELQKSVEEKTQELIQINNQLEERIKTEVEKNLKKDRLLSRQSKMAAMGEMIENIAHQWRQPLSIITTGASGLRLKKEFGHLDDDFFNETINTIISTSKHLSSTVNDFMYFFKPQENKSEFFVKDCVKKCLELLKPKLKDVHIIEDFQDIKIVGFQNELVQVFMNIITNAIDALESSNDEKMIFIKIYSINNSSVIKIKDNAGGIPEDIINKVSEPYFTTKHKSQGTGIGLYMCEEIVKQHMNGQLKIKNVTYTYNGKEYKGAQFSVVLLD